ncbi:MAG: carboxypeptidase-like regulatory domain-containing protein, partial [Chitinophagaceae bacterium]
MHKINLTLALLLTIFYSATAQQFQISGKITETNKEPVSFASVYVKNTTKGTSANAEGFYKLDLEKGTHTLLYKA